MLPRALVLVGLLLGTAVAPLVSQTPAPAKGPSHPAAGVRSQWAGLVAKGRAKDLETALKRRGGEVADVLLSGLTDPAAAAEATSLLPALPEVERAGCAKLLERLGGGNDADRAATLAALTAAFNLERLCESPKQGPKKMADDAAALAAKAREITDPYVRARAALGRGLAVDEGGPGTTELREALTAFRGAGDRYRVVLAAFLLAGALPYEDRAESETLRGEAATLMATLGAAADKGLTGVAAARCDLRMGLSAHTAGDDDGALVALTRARKVFAALGDAERESRALVPLAESLFERGAADAALEMLKPAAGRLAKATRADDIVPVARLVADALRRTGKGAAAVDILKPLVPRMKQIQAPPVDEALLLLAYGTALAQVNQTELAAVVLDTAGKLADGAGRPALARAARIERALQLTSLSRNDDAKKAFDEAAKVDLGKELGRIAAAGARLSWAEFLVDAKDMTAALPLLGESLNTADELALPADRLPGRGALYPSGGALPLATRFTRALATYAPKGAWKDLEPIFLAVERRVFDALADLAFEETAPAELALRTRRSDAGINRLRRAVAGLIPLPTEEEVAEILRERAALKEEAWKIAPGFALRRLPRTTPVIKAKDAVCGPTGAVFAAVASADGAFVMAFSRDGWSYTPIEKANNPVDVAKKFAKVARDPKSTPDQVLDASSLFTRTFMDPVAKIWENKKWLAVYLDPVMNEVPFAAALPGDAKSAPFAKMDWLCKRIAVGRLATANLAPYKGIAVGRPTWLSDPRGVAVGGGDPKILLPFAKAFDEALSAEKTTSDRGKILDVAAWTDGLGTGSAGFGRGGALVFGADVPPQALDLPRGAAPDVVALTAPADEKTILGLMARGAKGVLARVEDPDTKVLDAMTARALFAMTRQGRNPVEAVAEAQRALLSGELKIDGAPAPDSAKHPAVWSALRALVTEP